MSFNKRLLCILPVALKQANNLHTVTCNKILKQRMHIGYVVPLFNKTWNLRFISSKASGTNKKPVELEKVYYGVLTPQIKAVKIISFTTSIVGILAQPILFKQITNIGGGLPVIIGLCSFIGFFTFVTPFLLHYITKKYITHLDYNAESKKYIATVLTFFCTKRQIEFSLGDVKVPEIPGMFTSFLVNGRPLFVDPNLFTNPTHYGKIMGYDKPIDFKLTVPSNDKKT